MNDRIKQYEIAVRSFLDAVKSGDIKLVKKAIKNLDPAWNALTRKDKEEISEREWAWHADKTDQETH